MILNFLLAKMMFTLNCIPNNELIHMDKVEENQKVEFY